MEKTLKGTSRALMGLLLLSMTCSRAHTRPTPQPGAAAAVFVAVYDSLWKRPGISVRLIDSTIAVRNVPAESTT